jgi:hypothetical protein
LGTPFFDSYIGLLLTNLNLYLLPKVFSFPPLSRNVSSQFDIKQVFCVGTNLVFAQQQSGRTQGSPLHFDAFKMLIGITFSGEVKKGRNFWQTL